MFTRNLFFFCIIIPSNLCAMSFYSSSYYISSYGPLLAFNSNIKSYHISSHGPVLGFNSNIKVAKGEVEHFYIVNQLDITVTDKLFFYNSKIGGRLVINAGNVILRNVRAEELVVRKGATVTVVEDCTFGAFTQEDGGMIIHQSAQDCTFKLDDSSYVLLKSWGPTVLLGLIGIGVCIKYFVK